MEMPDSPDSIEELQADEGWASLTEGVNDEIEQTQRELKDLNLMVSQSQVEVEKLSQRNSTITMHLQQVQAKIDTFPTGEIQNAYDAAMDAQQRLVVMRSQLEKLQSDQSHLDRFLTLLNNVKTAMAGGPDEEGGANGASAGGGSGSSAEMMIQAQESERHRLSIQMHDGPAQTLSNFVLRTEIAMKLFDVDQDQARDELSSLKAAANTVLAQVRNFIYDLRPMMLDDLGLAPTIRRYGDAFREKSGMDVAITVTGTERRLESYLEVMLFRSMQELMNNAGKYSQASQVKVQMDMNPEDIRLVVEDNGKGFTEDESNNSSGLGIKLIRERTEMLGGSFNIDSVVGEGARIELDLPALDAPPE